MFGISVSNYFNFEQVKDTERHRKKVETKIAQKAERNVCHSAVKLQLSVFPLK